ncbi:MAG: MoaD/ThiS family protein [Streptosporangiaceae bacterium]
MNNVTIRYWAAAKAAAGTAQESVQADTLAAALTAALARREADSGLGTVLARSSFLVDGSAVGARAAQSVPLPEGAMIEVLPPFAGG